MIVEIQMAYISTTKVTSKNQSEPVFFRSINQKQPVLGGLVQSPKYLGHPGLVVVVVAPFGSQKTGLDWTFKH